MNTALHRSVVLYLTNKSGGDVAQGDVVILGSATAKAFTTTTTAGYTSAPAGVVVEPGGIANNGAGLVCLLGWVPKINLSGAATLYDYLATHSVAKQAAPHNAPSTAGDFATALQASATPEAFLFGLNLGGGAGDVATDAIWDTAGDLVQGTGSNAAARLAIGTARQSPRANSGETAVEWANQDCQVIGETVVGAGGVATVTFSAIPATFRHLRLLINARGDTAAANIGVNATINDDAGGNYAFQRAYVLNTTFTGTEYLNQSLTTIGFVPAGNATVNYSGAIDALFHNYAGAFFKPYFATFFDPEAATTGKLYTGYYAGLWRSTSAINKIVLAPNAGNFAQYSTFTLYGLMGNG